MSAAGVDLGGLDRAEARARVAASLAARLDRPVTVRVGPRSFSIRPSALYQADATETVERAFALGRESFGSRLRAAALPFTWEHQVEPVLLLRPEGPAALAAKVERVMRRPVSARVTMEGERPVVYSGRPGVTVDEQALADALLAAALTGDSEVEARIARVDPEITIEEAKAAAAQAETVVSAPVTVAYEDEPLGELTPSQLAKLVRFQPNEGAYELLLDRERLARRLEPLVAPKTIEPLDATFEVVGERVRVVPSKGGTKLAATQAQQAVLDAALSDLDRMAWLAFAKLEADLTTREAKALGISEEISTYTTDMGESSPNRILNVHLLGQYLDGTILLPGETFSFNRVIGPRTPERGFLEGQMIFAGVLIPSIGGGVCQTGTTIFNAAFEAGLPIKERHNHSFYISHYPLGRDATVSWGGPDLVFTNDLDNAILIKASWTDDTFTVTLYGTEQGRRVVSETSERTNYTQPKLQFAVDPTAPPKSVRTTKAGGPGFDVTVYRRVYEEDKLIRKDKFFTRYTPQNPTKVFGPARKPPGPYFVLPTTG